MTVQAIYYMVQATYCRFQLFLILILFNFYVYLLNKITKDVFNLNKHEV